MAVNSALRIPFVSNSLNNGGMQRIEEIYRARLALLVETKGNGRQSILSKMIDKSPAQVSQWINASKDAKTQRPRSMDRATARHIERALKLPDGWMDQPVTPGERKADGSSVVQLPSANEGIRNLVLRFAELLKPLDEADREQAEVLMRKLAMQPEKAEQWADKLGRLLGEFWTDEASRAAGGER
jgi:hypothetical protein